MYEYLLQTCLLVIGLAGGRRSHRLIPVTSHGQCDKVARESPLSHSVVPSLNWKPCAKIDTIVMLTRKHLERSKLVFYPHGPFKASVLYSTSLLECSVFVLRRLYAPGTTNKHTIGAVIRYVLRLFTVRTRHTL